MTKTLTAALAGLFLVGYLVTADFTPPQPDPVIRDTYQSIWAPVVSTDCESWEIRQSDAALNDLWTHADYMTIGNGETYGPDDTITVPYEGDRGFVFRFHADGQQIYQVDLTVETRC